MIRRVSSRSGYEWLTSSYTFVYRSRDEDTSTFYCDSVLVVYQTAVLAGHRKGTWEKYSDTSYFITDQGIWEKQDQAKSLKKVCLHARDRQGGFTEYHSETLEFTLASWQRESQTHLCFPRENGCANTQKLVTIHVYILSGVVNSRLPLLSKEDILLLGRNGLGKTRVLLYLAPSQAISMNCALSHDRAHRRLKVIL